MSRGFGSTITDSLVALVNDVFGDEGVFEKRVKRGAKNTYKKPRDEDEVLISYELRDAGEVPMVRPCGFRR